MYFYAIVGYTLDRATELGGQGSMVLLKVSQSHESRKEIHVVLNNGKMLYDTMV